MNDLALQQKIKELEKKVEALSKLIQVNGSQVTLKSQANLVIEATTINIKAGGTLDINGAIIKLNNGGKPAARLGSRTAGNQATQTIIDGSPTVMMP